MLATACFTRPAGPEDAVDGVQPELVAEPASVEEASELLAAADREGIAVIPRGGGTRLGWGNPPRRADLVVSTARLDRVLEHAAGDLVVRVEAGVPLADLQAALAPAGQMLALDPPWARAGATAGGAVATNAAGPRRLRYGTARDLLIGVTVVLAGGRVARAGGKVVKNVAGYDLCKLLAGSFGTLGLIVEATFRLHPVPAAARAVAVEVERPEQAAEAASRLVHSTLVPSAIELSWPERRRPGTLTVLFEGIEPGAEAQAAAAARLLSGGESAAIAAGLGALPWEDGEVGVVGVKATCPPADLAAALATLWDAAEAEGLVVKVSGHAGTGVLYATLRPGPGPQPAAPDLDALARFVAAARARLVAAGGSLVLGQAPPELKRAVEAWGPVGDALDLMRRVKERFDPTGAMSPGRFVGGI